MKSGLRRAARPRNSTPVPMGATAGFYSLSGLANSGSQDEALMRAYGTQGTVFSNVSLLAAATAGPTWKLFRKDDTPSRSRYTTNDQGSDQRVEVKTHAALSLLNNPASVKVNGRDMAVWTRFSLFELSQVWMETTGKSHWVVDRSPLSPVPLGLWPVRPDRLQPVPDAQNWLKGWVYTAPDGREKIPLQPDDVIYNRYPDPLDVYGGCGPLQSVLVDIDAAKYSAEWNRNFFVNGARPDAVLQVDHAFEDDTEFEQLMSRWREAHRGVARAHRVAVLEAGVTYVPVSMTMKDMDFQALRSSSRDIIREALGMHKVMTGVSDDVNRANAQTGEEVFASWKISPRLDRWRDVLNYQLLPLFGSAGEGVEWDYVYPMPQNREQDNAELTAKTTAAALLVAQGFDPEDVCQVVGLPVMRFSRPAAPPPVALPAAPGAGEQAAESAGGGDAVSAALQRALMGQVTGARPEFAALNMAGRAA